MSKEEVKKKIYNIEERSAKFGEEVIDWVRKIPNNGITSRLIPQLVASATSIGANCCEADCAESNKDFIHKMSIANKEAKESKHFIRMLSKASLENANTGRILWKEGHEINLILVTIVKNAKETEEKKKIENSNS
jgi:four helix bundle protein